MGGGWGGHQAPQEGEKKPTAWNFTGRAGELIYVHRCPHTWAHKPHPQRLVLGNSVSYIQNGGGGAVVLRVEWCSLAERECPKILGYSTLFCGRIPKGGREWEDKTIHLHGQLEPLHSLLVVHYCFKTAPVLFRV